MRSIFSAVAAAAICLSVASPFAAAGLSPAHTLDLLPMAFEPAPTPGVDYVARGPGYAAHVGQSGIALQLQTPHGAGARLGWTLVGAKSGRAAVAEDLLPGRSHYLIGGDPAAWRRDVPRYRQLRYR